MEFRLPGLVVVIGLSGNGNDQLEIESVDYYSRVDKEIDIVNNRIFKILGYAVSCIVVKRKISKLTTNIAFIGYLDKILNADRIFTDAVS